MPLTTGQLFRDSVNFFRNQQSGFIALALISSVFYFLLYSVFVPDFSVVKSLLQIDPSTVFAPSDEFINKVNQLSDNQRTILQQEMFKIGFISLLPSIIGYGILICGTVTIINNVVNKQTMSFFSLSLQTVIFLPKVLVMLLFILFSSILGLSFLIIPGLVIGFSTALAPIISLSGQLSLWQALRTSFQLSFKYFRVVLQVLLLTISVKFLLSIVLTNLIIGLSLPGILVIIATAITNIILILMILSLVRFYMLLNTTVNN